MRLSGHSREGAVCLPSESRKSRPGAFWGRKTPLILTLTQSLHRQITHRLGGADAHCDMPILNAHSRRRAVPPLANCFRIKARVPVAVGLAALRMLLTPFMYSLLAVPLPMGRPFLLRQFLLFTGIVKPDNLTKCIMSSESVFCFTIVLLLFSSKVYNNSINYMINYYLR